jgi:hypothetical protein
MSHSWKVVRLAAVFWADFRRSAIRYRILVIFSRFSVRCPGVDDLCTGDAAGVVAALEKDGVDGDTGVAAGATGVGAAAAATDSSAVEDVFDSSTVASVSTLNSTSPTYTSDPSSNKSSTIFPE